MGGYNIYSGVAWRLQLPLDLTKRAHINTLEFMASVITIWIDAFHNKIAANDCILSQTDSTTAAGWLRKSNFSDNLLLPESSLRLVVARKLASLLIDTSSCLYSQWFKGDLNNIADTLSRAHNLSNSELSSFLTSSFPEQTPAGITIYDLPKEILYWTSLMLQKLPKQPPSFQAHQENINDLGQDGSSSCPQLEYHPTTPSWITSQHQRNTNSSVPSSQQLETTNSPILNKIDLRLSNPSLALLPWDMWHRPSQLLIDKTQDLPVMENLPLFYAGN
jgi:hypothetical protein